MRLGVLRQLQWYYKFTLKGERTNIGKCNGHARFVLPAQKYYIGKGKYQTQIYTLVTVPHFMPGVLDKFLQVDSIGR